MKQAYRHFAVATMIAAAALLPAAARAHTLSICKQSDATNPITGTFTFTIVGVGNVNVDVGSCSSPVAIEGSVTVTEAAKTGSSLVNIFSPTGNSVTADLTARSAVVTVSGVTQLTFVNAGTPSGVNGRWTGGGSIFTPDGTRVTHGFEIHCETSDLPNNLEINWGGNRFHLDVETSATCTIDPATGIATIVGTGTGSYNGSPGATISFTFTDAGEPGRNDFASYLISFGSSTVLSASGNLTFGNQEFHKDNK